MQGLAGIYAFTLVFDYLSKALIHSCKSNSLRQPGWADIKATAALNTLSFGLFKWGYVSGRKSCTRRKGEVDFGKSNVAEWSN